MFVFKKYDRQNHVWSFMTKYLRFLRKFTSWSGETPTGNYSDVFFFLSWTRIMSVLIDFIYKTIDICSIFNADLSFSRNNFLFSFFKKYDRQNHVWSFMTKYLRFLRKFTSWSGETPTGNYSDVFLSWTRIMSALIGHWYLFNF
jgi:hypothetical protein